LILKAFNSIWTAALTNQIKTPKRKTGIAFSELLEYWISAAIEKK